MPNLALLTTLSVTSRIQFIAPNINNSVSAGNNRYCSGGHLSFYEYSRTASERAIPYVLTISNLVVGSDVVILIAGTNTIIASYDQITSSYVNYTYSDFISIDIGVLEQTRIPLYFRNYQLLNKNTTIPLVQKQDRNYV